VGYVRLRAEFNAPQTRVVFNFMLAISLEPLIYWTEVPNLLFKLAKNVSTVNQRGLVPPIIFTSWIYTRGKKQERKIDLTGRRTGGRRLWFTCDISIELCAADIDKVSAIYHMQECILHSPARRAVYLSPQMICCTLFARYRHNISPRLVPDHWHFIFQMYPWMHNEPGRQSKLSTVCNAIAQRAKDLDMQKYESERFFSLFS
jgi:hypothetical protein